MWKNVSCHRRGRRGGGAIVLLQLFLFQMIPPTFPSRPYFSLICRQEQVRVMGAWLSGTGFPFVLSPEGVGCGLHVLYITDICHAGVSNSNKCETFLPSDWAQQGRRSRRRPVLFSRWSAWTSIVKRSEQRWGAACRAFQLLNQNSNVSVFIFLPFIH